MDHVKKIGNSVLENILLTIKVLAYNVKIWFGLVQIFLNRFCVSNSLSLDLIVPQSQYLPVWLCATFG